jgi:hypothetical protein
VADGDLTLESLDVGALPIVRPILERLRVRDLLDAAFGKVDARLKLALPDTAMVIVQNIILSRHPLYGVPEWARRHVPELLGLEPDQIPRRSPKLTHHCSGKLTHPPRRRRGGRYAAGACAGGDAGRATGAARCVGPAGRRSSRGPRGGAA